MQQQPVDKEMFSLKTPSQFQRAQIFVTRLAKKSLSLLSAQNANHVGVRVGSVPDKLW
jgi:hypothetical protein